MEAFAKTSKVIGHDWTVTKNVAGTSYKKKKKDTLPASLYCSNREIIKNRGEGPVCGSPRFYWQVKNLIILFVQYMAQDF